MPKASEIARARTHAKDADQWLAAIAGLVGAMFCAVVALILAPVTWGFFASLGVAVAAVAIPCAIALRSMDRSSAEFRTVWMAVLAVMLVLWVAVGGWLKRTTGTDMALREIEAEDRAADLWKAELDAGRRPPARPRPEPTDSRNGFAQAAAAFRRHDWRSVENYRRCMAALDGVDWQAMSDPWKTGPASTHAEKEARYGAGIAAVDAWHAAERDSVKTLRAEIAALKLPDPLATRLARRFERLDDTAQVLAYSENLLLERARQVTAVLDAGDWSRDADAIRFRGRDDATAYARANDLLMRAIRNRKSVRQQLHGTAAPVAER